MMNAYSPRIYLFISILIALFAVELSGQVSWITTGPSYKVIRAIAVSPQDTNVIFTGAFGWGVFKSTDGGTSWVSVKNGLTNGYVRSVVVISNTTVFCGTNDGVFKTTNGGTSWTMSISTPFSVRGLAYDAVSGSLFAATYGSGLYKTTNQGTSWNTVAVSDPVSNETLLHQWSVSLFGTDSLYVGGSIGDIGSGGALFRSTNGGTSWEQVQRSIGIRSSVRSIAVSTNSPASSLIIGTAAKGVYKSTNAGVNWTEINGGTTPNPLQDLQINAVEFTSSFRYAGTDSLGGLYYRSLGDTTVGWLQGNGLPGTQAPVTSMAVNPLQQNTIILGTEGFGVYRSIDAGATWVSRNNGMLGTAPRVIRRNGDGHIFAGMEFGDGLWMSNNQGFNWSRVAALNTSNAITSIGITSSPSTIYTAAYGTGVYRSNDAGVTWVLTDTTAINHFVRTLSVHPSNANKVFAGTGNGVYVTNDGGISWVPANNGIPAGTSIRSMALDTIDPNTIYVGTDSLYLFRTTDAGTSWVNVSSANGFLPQDIFIRSLTIDYLNHTTVYAGADSGRIYKSTNSGVSWALHSQLPIVHSVRNIMIHSTDHKIFFCATFGDGIFASADSGSHWQSINLGLSDLEFYTLESDPSDPFILYAGSGTHGVYRTTYTFVNHPPVLGVIGNKNVLAGNTLEFIVTAADSEMTIPALTVNSLSPGASFVDSANGHGLFTWTPTLGQIGNYQITFAATDGVLADSEQITISVLDPGSSVILPMELQSGWNLVSVPVVVGNYQKSALFSEASSSAFSYTGSYAVRETLINGAGYWVKYPSSQSFTLGGQPITQETVAVNNNWNIIGSLSNTVSATVVTPVPPLNITSSIFGFSAVEGYSTADSIHPGSGYWIKADRPGFIVINPLFSGKYVNNMQVAAGPLRDRVLSDDRFTFTDEGGSNRILTLMTDNRAGDTEEISELPPMPPEGVFDVRYGSSDKSGEVLHENIIVEKFPVEISNPGSVVKISWDIHNADASYQFSVESIPLVIPMQGKGSISIPVIRQHIRAWISVNRTSAGDNQSLPQNAVLEQNYPNPFNPSTLFSCKIPQGGFVQLKIFDPLGREIATLINEQLSPGVYTRTWDAQGMAAGVYYYRIDIVPIDQPGLRSSQVRKMVLLK